MLFVILNVSHNATLYNCYIVSNIFLIITTSSVFINQNCNIVRITTKRKKFAIMRKIFFSKLQPFLTMWHLTLFIDCLQLFPYCNFISHTMWLFKNCDIVIIARSYNCLSYDSFFTMWHYSFLQFATFSEIATLYLGQTDLISISFFGNCHYCEKSYNCLS